MLRDAITKAVSEMDCGADQRAIDALVRHADMLLEANTRLNLTRIVEDEALAVGHVADSLSALPYLATAPAGAFADLGSGGGYPGVPLAICSNRHVVLIESTRKKAAFLTEVIEALGLDAEVLPFRAEEVAEGGGVRLAAVVARAVSALPSLVELASPLLQAGGLLIAMKGRLAADELERGDAAAALVGMVRLRRDSVEVPGLEAERVIACYERSGSPRVRLPRRPGLAQRKPLA
jgi:16S rRNA (guanine527-N7)-methyltransferase